MKKLFLLLFVLGTLQIGMFAQTKWSVDKAHSSIKFTVTHLVITDVDGNFKSFDGSVAAASPDFTDADINFTADVKSLNTENEMRDNHLKSPDFFDAEKFPQIVFKSTSFKKTTGNKYELKGNLTMHGITKPVKFDVTFGGTAKDPYGNTKAGFKASTVINRFDYELKWNKLTEAGGAVVGQDVTIEVKVELNQAK
jgi:polyisoprenoid-binding protein YceI